MGNGVDSARSEVQKRLNLRCLSQDLPNYGSSPKFYGLPKIHKDGIPLRPVVRSVDSITFSCAKHLAELIAPVVGKTESFVKNSQHFATLLQNKYTEELEELQSFDVKSLFTSVPVIRAVDVIHTKLETDSTLENRTVLSPTNIAKLLKFCLSCTYFVSGGRFYKKIRGAPMGSSVSPTVCNAYNYGAYRTNGHHVRAQPPSMMVPIRGQYALQTQPLTRPGIHGPPQFY